MRQEVKAGKKAETDSERPSYSIAAEFQSVEQAGVFRHIGRMALATVPERNRG